MASALLHMSCPPLKNDIIGMESNSLNDALQGLERSKRDHDLDDLERCQVKKRRKQSKPNRIASTESLTDPNGKSTIWPAFQQNQCALPLKESGFESDQDPGYCEALMENKKDDLKSYTDEEESNEENCSAMYEPNLKKELPFPLNLSHKSPSPQNSGDSFSSTLDERSWYKNPDNASLLYNVQQTSDPINLKTQPYQSNLFQPSQACNIILPTFKRILVGNNENQIGSPHRIFNPEAFCDLCNKEFCNKYFLKTHKANKHGIYMENIGPSTMDNLTTLPLMNYFSSSIANLSITNNQPSKKISSSFSTSSNKSNSSMRAFCNICQREFCNKYFVRRHKAKIHGIVENTGEPDFKQSSLDKPEQLESNLPGPSAFKFNKEYQSKDLPEPLIDEEKLNVKKEENDPEENDSPHDALSLLVSSWQSEDSKDCSKSPDRNKKMPNSNSSAFCEICCKEYCNKYFLRVHKQKCHGIPMPEKDERPKEQSNSICKTAQPMPLNLILRENNKNQIEPENSYTCNICNIHFTDSYSLKLHHDQIHKCEKSNDKPVQCNPAKVFSPLEPEGIKPNVELRNHRTVEAPNHTPIQQQEPQVCQKKNSHKDIQQMNTMLLKLNQHIPFENYMCDVCNQDFGSMSSLENHIIRDHASLIEEISNSFYEENQNFQSNQLNKLECTKCQKQFNNISQLEQHFTEKHCEPKSTLKIPSESQDFNAQLGIASDRQIMHTPTSSFCEICKKELCNKYFMKTHMQRMHGISIENGAHIGGVVCDICNKELCSKYFLRVHKQNSHGIVEEAFLPQIGTEIKVPISNVDVALRPNDNELSHRYFSHFTEVCSICNRRFRSAKWLRAHLLNDHGEEGKEKWKEVQIQNGNKNDRSITDSGKKLDPFYSSPFKNFISDISTNDGTASTSDTGNDILPPFLNRATQKQYQCTYCPFSSTVLALLLVHERTHLSSGPDTQDYRCPVCSLQCDNNEGLEKHLAFKHNSSSFNLKKTSEETNQINDHSPLFQYEDIETRRVPIAKEDNNFEETHDSKTPASPSADACLKCTQCSFVTTHIELYSEHIKNEHKAEEPPMDYLQILRDALLQIANNSHIPASFAVPSNLGNFMMQPFVLEDKAFGANSSSTFLSSLVFLPVKERLNKPITASFKLTPT